MCICFNSIFLANIGSWQSYTYKNVLFRICSHQQTNHMMERYNSDFNNMFYFHNLSLYVFCKHRQGTFANCQNRQKQNGYISHWTAINEKPKECQVQDVKIKDDTNFESIRIMRDEITLHLFYVMIMQYGYKGTFFCFGI